MNRDEYRINDIKCSIIKIKDGLSGRKLYELDDIEKFGVIFLLQIIGEASRSLSDDFKSKNNQVPWREIIAFRNFVVHQYADIKWEVIEKIIDRDLAELEKKIESCNFSLKED